MDNCLTLGKGFLGLRTRFAFCDDDNHSSVSLFNRNRVRITPKGSWIKDGVKYRIVLCSVRTKDVPLFRKAMEELKTKMLLIGNTDYEAFCEEIIPGLREAGEK